MPRGVAVELYGGPLDGAEYVVSASALPTLQFGGEQPNPLVTYSARPAKHYTVAQQVEFLKRIYLYFDGRS